MDSEVYANEEVENVLESRFVAIKLNAESSKPLVFHGSEMTEAQFAGASGVTGYPTTLFLDPSGKPITKVAGYIKAGRFRRILQYIGEDHYKTVSFKEYLDRTGGAGE